jgi:hypothetical protein
VSISLCCIIHLSFNNCVAYGSYSDYYTSEHIVLCTHNATTYVPHGKSTSMYQVDCTGRLLYQRFLLFKLPSFVCILAFLVTQPGVSRICSSEKEFSLSRRIGFRNKRVDSVPRYCKILTCHYLFSDVLSETLQRSSHVYVCVMRTRCAESSAYEPPTAFG